MEDVVINKSTLNLHDNYRVVSLFLSVLLFIPANIAAQTVMVAYSTSSGAGKISGAQCQLDGILGQSIAGCTNSSNTIADAGFIYFRCAGSSPDEVRVFDPKIPSTYELGQNYPNPFNPSTTISFSLPREEFVSLKVFDLLGREIAVLVYGKVPAGYHTAMWNVGSIRSGVYFYRIQAGSFIQTRKLVLIK